MIEHGIKHPLSAWFVEMGLGKTASRLAVWQHLFAEGALQGVLVVAPLRVAVLTWPNEVSKWDNFRWMKVADLRTKAGVKAWEEGTADIYTINYESLPRFTRSHLKGKRASQLPVNEVFFDESDYAKNPDSKRINEFRKYGRPKFKRCGIQTGTPIPNSQIDIFAQIRLLDMGSAWKSPINPDGNAFTQWRKQYFELCDFSEYPKYILREGTEGLIEENIKHLSLVMRTKDHADWQPPLYRDVNFTLPPEAKKVYKDVEKKLLHEIRDGVKIVAVNAAALVTKLLQITSGSVYTTVDLETDLQAIINGETDELPDVEKQVEFIHDAKIKALQKLHKDNHFKPMLVACQYIHERERILASIPGAEVFSNDRLDAWNRGEIPMIVAHPKSIGHGLNMQAGGNIICWYTLGYSRGLYDQFNARLARQGQSEQTIVYHLICKETIDEAVMGALESKDKNQKAFMTTLKNFKLLSAK